MIKVQVGSLIKGLHSKHVNNDYIINIVALTEMHKTVNASNQLFVMSANQYEVAINLLKASDEAEERVQVIKMRINNNAYTQFEASCVYFKEQMNRFNKPIDYVIYQNKLMNQIDAEIALDAHEETNKTATNHYLLHLACSDLIDLQDKIERIKAK